MIKFKCKQNKKLYKSEKKYINYSEKKNGKFFQLPSNQSFLVSVNQNHGKRAKIKIQKYFSSRKRAFTFPMKKRIIKYSVNIFPRNETKTNF